MSDTTAGLGAEPLDTSNVYAVAAHAGRVVSFRLRDQQSFDVTPFGVTPEVAIRLAAWLIVAADLAVGACDFEALDRTTALVKAIRET